MKSPNERSTSTKVWIVIVSAILAGTVGAYLAGRGGAETSSSAAMDQVGETDSVPSEEVVIGNGDDISFDGGGSGDTLVYPGKSIDGLELLEKEGYTCVGLDAEKLSGDDPGSVVGGDRYQRPSTLMRESIIGTPAEIYDCLLACFPGEGDILNSNLLRAGGPCLNAQLAKMSNKWGKEVWMDSVEAFIHDHPEAGDMCHGGAHIAGKNEVLKHGGEPMETLTSFTRLCNSGFQHGTLDALSILKPSTKDMRTLAAECVKLDSVLSGECIHGIGHAAYDVSQTLEEASSICEVYNDDEYRGCSYGIVMRRFWREIQKSEAEDVPELIADAERLCQKWPDKPLPQGGRTLNGCWYAVPYQMWFPIQGGILGTITMAEMGEYIGQISAACGRAPEADLGSVCESEAGRYTANAARWVLDDAIKLCSYTRDTEGCVAAAEDAVEATMLQRGLSS